MTRPADNPTEATQAQEADPGPASESLERIAETLTETSMSAGVDVAAQTIADSFDGLDAETLKSAHLAAIGVVFRMIVGPTILDRALSTDSLVTLVVMGMALHVAHTGAAWAGPAMLSLTGLAFVGTVTFARFVAREDPMQGRRRPHPEEPGTDTGPHEAIHLETDSASEDGFGSEDDLEAGSRADGDSEGGLGAEDGTAPEAGFGADSASEVGFGAEGDRGFEDEDQEGAR